MGPTASNRKCRSGHFPRRYFPGRIPRTFSPPGQFPLPFLHGVGHPLGTGVGRPLQCPCNVFDMIVSP